MATNHPLKEALWQKWIGRCKSHQFTAFQVDGLPVNFTKIIVNIIPES